MSSPSTPNDQDYIHELISRYREQQYLLEIFVNNIDGMISKNKKLAPFVHSTKKRLKSFKSLEDKLNRQNARDLAEGNAFHITPENLFTEINDLAGYRVLHLHTTQMEQIHSIMLELFEENQHRLVEPPKANIWDEESRTFFERIGIETKVNPRLYASVHYVIESPTKTKLTCEIQVRTLADELWGEVDHKINYPHPTESVACGEQIRVLARVSSSASRLVDSIFRSHQDFLEREDDERSRNSP